MRAPIIAFTGPARSGKDTAGDFVVSMVGGYRYSFADPLRAMLVAGFGIDMNEKFWKDNKEKEIAALGKSPRRMMQTLGTEWGRDLIHPDVWVIVAKQQLINRGPGMVICDVRFENEAAWVRKNNGLLIHINRDSGTSVEAHSSENGVQPGAGDIELSNNGTLEQLQDKLTELLRGF